MTNTKRNMLKLKTFIFAILGNFVAVNTPILAQELTLWTTHPQVAYDLNLMANQYYANSTGKIPFKAQSIFKLQDNTDIHQFEPSSGELKKLSSYSPIIIGPLMHQPWAKLALKSGLFAQKPDTLVLKEKESEDHYWLSIKGSKEFEQEMNIFFKAQNLPVRNDLPWSQMIEKEALEIKTLLMKKGIKKIVLAHNALVPLIKEFGVFESLVLYTEDHHREVSAGDLKKVFKWADVPSETLFIYERNLSWPAPLQTEQFKEIRKVQWNPVSPYPLESLKKLFEAQL